MVDIIIHIIISINFFGFNNLIAVLLPEKGKNLQKFMTNLPIHLQVNFQYLLYTEQHILLIINVSPTPKSPFQNKLTYFLT